ncbi:MAG: hypothetical protein NT007_06420 [Candidatus Kapabacteria bacterium]|nr:hypothetical protein [Candidatus Kapabacteria bacterium]
MKIKLIIATLIFGLFLNIAETTSKDKKSEKPQPVSSLNEVNMRQSNSPATVECSLQFNAPFNGSGGCPDYNCYRLTSKDKSAGMFGFAVKKSEANQKLMKILGKILML